METLVLKKEWIVKCLNCGNDAHDGPLFRTEQDYDGREYEIEVCRHSRYEVVKWDLVNLKKIKVQI